MKSLDMSPEEVQLWNDVLGKVDKDTFGVEIGCLFGDSANAILKSSPHINLISIDPFIPDSMEASLIGSYEDSILKNKEFALSGRFTIFQDYSYNRVGVFGNNKLDFLFLDGDHRYESILQDFIDWVPKLKVGGLLFIHDSRVNRPNGAPFWEGPSKVADENIFNNPDKWEIVAEAFSLTCARKLKE